MSNMCTCIRIKNDFTNLSHRLGTNFRMCRCRCPRPIFVAFLKANSFILYIQSWLLCLIAFLLLRAQPGDACVCPGVVQQDTNNCDQNNSRGDGKENGQVVLFLYDILP